MRASSLVQVVQPAGCCRPRTAAGGGRPQVGLEVVEKLLTSFIDAANKTSKPRSSRAHAMHGVGSAARSPTLSDASRLA
jgi:hypothetical protein